MSPKSYVSLAVLLLGSLAHRAIALGINCRGSGECPIFLAGDPSRRVIDQLQIVIQANVSDTRVFQNGQHIACIDGHGFLPLPPQPDDGDDEADGSDNAIGEDRPQGSICAFLQGTAAGVSGADIKTHLQTLIDHGCKACGSVPTTGVNDVRYGQLTLNYVDRFPTGDAQCPGGILGGCQFE